MTHRERFFAAVNHQKCDRAPADFSSTKPVAEGLRARLGVNTQEEMLEALGIDMRAVGFDYHQQGQVLPDAEGWKKDIWGVLRKPYVEGSGEPSVIAAFNEHTTLQDIEAHPWPSAARLDFSNVKSSLLAHHDKYITYGGPWCPFFHEASAIMVEADFYVKMHTDPEVVHALIKNVVDYEIMVWRKYLDAAQGLLDVMYVGNDFGTQLSLVVSPAMWEKFVRKPLKRFYDLGHEYGCRVMQHSCGAIGDIIPWLIADGVDILDPIQVACSGMGLGELKNSFGSKITFHGGVDTQTVLPFGSVSEVRRQVNDYLQMFRESGGYILTSSQALMEDIPYDNILAMYEENNRK